MLRRSTFFLIIGLLILATGPTYLPGFTIYLLTYGMIMSIAALALNLLLGYTGLMSFGHGMFIGAGAYTVALMMKYAGIHSFEILIPLSILISAGLAALVGCFCTRQIEIYFSMLTLAFGELLFVLFSKFYSFTGGTDGIRVKMPTLFGYIFSRGATDFYYFVLALFLLCTAAIWVICHSPFGKTIQAVRDNEVRVGYLGLSVVKYRLIAFIISGAFTGLAGVLAVSLTGHAVPELFQIFTSISIVFMVILGGHTSFLGPVVGAIVFVFLQSWLKPLFFWQFFLGVSIILLVIFLPGGVVGGVSIWLRKALAKTSS
jgi:branched-chain amino acid transport system permease protein